MHACACTLYIELNCFEGSKHAQTPAAGPALPALSAPPALPTTPLLPQPPQPTLA